MSTGNEINPWYCRNLQRIDAHAVHKFTYPISKVMFASVPWFQIEQKLLHCISWCLSNWRNRKSTNLIKLFEYQRVILIYLAIPGLVIRTSVSNVRFNASFTMPFSFHDTPLPNTVHSNSSKEERCPYSLVMN